MSTGGIASDDKIDICHDRSTIHERARRRVQLIAKIHDRERQIRRSKLFGAFTLLQTDQRNARNGGQWCKLNNTKRTIPIAGIIGAALPRNADLKAAQTGQSLAPQCCELSTSAQIGYRSGYAFIVRAKYAREAQ